MKSVLGLFEFKELGPYRFGIYFSFTNAFVWMIALGAPMVLLAEELGASTFHVGLLYSAVFLLLPIQVLSTSLLPWLGYKRQLIGAWMVRAFFLLIPLILAIKGAEEPGGLYLYLFMFSILAFCFFRAIGACAVLPWLYDILPKSIQGRYFASDSLAFGTAGVLTLLMSSALFYILDTYMAFSCLYVLTVMASAVSLFLLNKLPNGNRPQVVPLFRLFRRSSELFSRPSHFRRFLSYQILNAIVSYAFAPFSLYYLKTSLNYSESYILALTGIQFLGVSVAAFVLREWVDRIGAKPFFIISHSVTLLFQLFWLIMILLPGKLEFLLPCVYFFVGVAMANLLVATNKYLPLICRPKERALSVSILSATVGCLGGLASTLWGLLFKDADSGKILTGAFITYFVVASVIQIYLVWVFLKIKERMTEPRELQASGFWVRPMRQLMSFIDLVESPRRK